MPVNYDNEQQHESYNIYPSFEIKEGNIQEGFHSLAKKIATEQRICIDGYIGVNWDDFITNLTVALKKIGIDCIAFFRPV